ncbi:uncharacterized protein LOC132184758 [Corylus avellana]|uniref:uncharacterized protein LOC132184758 n=1 Tax=Corylus avellana TaxID=13451 RepID=UPI00286A6E41|nr:uncharacterized protein LOC132184758 [Corylus avellana]
MSLLGLSEDIYKTNPSMSSNLERFLQYVTPTVPSRSLPQSCFDNLNSLWQSPGKDTIEYFTLRDLWECYDEWSAYGAGTPVLLNGGETVMQYYVPYLSALQICTNKSAAASRNRKEDSDVVEFENDSWSDDSGSDNLSTCLSNNSSKAWDAVSEESCLDQEGSWPMRDRLGSLYLQYIEMASPYWRVPLMDKITELAQNYPSLMTLKNVDLSPASWMAVAWYPIYHIPSQKNEKDLSACFLSYHTLSSTFQDNAAEDADTINRKETLHPEAMRTVGDKSKEESGGGISLPPFGLATYKLQGDLWIKPHTSDRERMIHLYSAAESWLKQLGIQHHDFNFFSFHCTL